MYLCKVVSRKREIFRFLASENQPFWLLFKKFLNCWRGQKIFVICIYGRVTRASDNLFSFQTVKPTILCTFNAILTAGKPEKLCNMYLCKIISRQRGNFQFLSPENQPFWLILTNLDCSEVRKNLVVYIYIKLPRASEEMFSFQALKINHFGYF